MELYFEWCEEKRKINLKNHGLDFEDAAHVWASIKMTQQDNRKDYGEKRYIALGLLNQRVVVMVYVIRGINTVRLISFRKANVREVKIYEKNDKIIKKI
ncbi:MAG: BrnT family toxin [Gammaproteobacteria bacterium]|jgi:uncharacterized DUF497 family protein